MDEIAPKETNVIRSCLQHQHLDGTDGFRRAVEAQLGHSIEPRKIGRPRKASEPLEVINAWESLR